MVLEEMLNEEELYLYKMFEKRKEIKSILQENMREEAKIRKELIPYQDTTIAKELGVSKQLMFNRRGNLYTKIKRLWKNLKL